jgi:hypothetical protein
VKEKGESSLFIRKILKTLPPLKPRLLGRGPTTTRARGYAARVHTRPRGHGPTRTPHVRTDALTRPHGRGFYRVRRQ